MLNVIFIIKDNKAIKMKIEDIHYLPAIGDNVSFDNVNYKVTQRVFLPEERIVQIFIEQNVEFDCK